MASYRNVLISHPTALFSSLLIALFLLLASNGTTYAQTSGVIGTCMGPQNCTANDGGFSGFDVISGPTSCLEGEPVTFQLGARLNTAQPTRYDIGIWVALNGLTPQQPPSTGNNCYRDILSPLAPGTPLNLTGGFGGFRNLDGDACGDASSGEQNFKVLSPITITCSDASSDGRLDVGACTSYAQNQQSVCNGASDISPGTGSKCECANVPIGQVDVRRPAYLEVRKIIEPSTAPGSVALSIIGTDAFTTFQHISNNVGNLGSTGRLTVTAGSRLTPNGTYTITESAETGTNLADFDTTVLCVQRNDGATVAGPVAATSLSFTVRPGDDIICTFTNRYNKGTLEIRKVVDVPSSEWNLIASGSTPFSQTVIGNGTTGARTVLTGSYTISEIGVGTTNLADYNTTWACTIYDAQSAFTTVGNGATTSVMVSPNKNTVCTFANTRRTGQIVISKLTEGGDAAFDFTGPGGGLAPSFQITTSGGSGQTTFNSAPTGVYTVSEGALPAGWDFASLVCSDPSNNTAINGVTATINVGDGETVICTYTNVRRGSLSVTKIVDANGFDPNQPPLSDQQYEIRVEGVDATFSQTNTLLAGETWTLDNLMPGQYRVEELAPTPNDGWLITIAPVTPTVVAGQNTAVEVRNMPLQGELLIVKTVNPEFVREYVWAITKTVDPPSLDLFVGDRGEFTYTLEVARTPRPDRDFRVTGSVQISNPSTLPVLINQPVDMLSQGDAVTLNCPVTAWPYRIEAGAELICTYNHLLSGNPTAGETITNTVTVSLTNGVVYSQNAPFEFDAPTIEIDREVTLEDALLGLNQSIVGDTTISYPTSATCDSFTNWQNGGNSGGYDIFNTATLSGTLTAEEDSATIRVNCYRLGIRKTAETSYVLTTTWDIAKTVDQPTVDLFDGDSRPVTYTVAITNTGAISGSWRVDGTLTISNPAPMTASISSISDILNESFSGVVSSCAPDSNSIEPNSEITCDYFIDLSNAGAINGENVAMVVLVNMPSGATAFTGTQAVDFGEANVTPVNTSVSVNDSFAGDLGSFTGAGSQATYTRTLTCPVEETYIDGSAWTVIGNTATINETGQRDDADVLLTCYRPSISKDAAPSYTVTYTWQLAKQVYPPVVDLFDGADATLNYTVTATRDNGAPGSYAVTGVITVTNPHTNQAISLTGAVIDEIEGGIAATVNCPSSVAAQSSATCAYSASLPDNAQRENTASLTLFGFTYTGTATIDFSSVTPTEVDPSLTVIDSYDQAGSPWIFQTSGSQTYSRPVNCAAFSDEEYVDGVADALITNTTNAAPSGAAPLSATANATLNCYRPLVSKDVNTSFTRTYTWTVEKTVDPVRLDLFEGETATVTYTIAVVKSDPIDSDFGVSGVISITNPHPTQTATFDVQDVLPGGLVAQVTCGSGGSTITVGAGQTATCTYMASPDGVISGTNVATATMQTNSGARSYTGVAAVNFGAPTNVVDDSVYIFDTNPDYDGPFESNESFTTTYSVENDCTGVDFGEALSLYQQVDNTVTIFSPREVELDSDAATVDLSCHRPIVTKTAQGAYGRTYDWAISKSADPTRLDLFEGETTIVTYTIDVTRTLASEEGFWVSGNIEIFNPNPQRNLSISVVDQLDNGQQLPTNCPATVAPNTTMTCSYGGFVNDVTANSIVTNTAIITTGAGLAYSSVPVAVDFGQVQPSTLLDSVTITDSQTSQTWVMNDSDTIRYTLPQGCADIVFASDDTIYRDTLVNTASVRELSNRSSTATVDLNCYRLAVSKDVNTSFTRQHFWDIEKTVDPATWDVFVGDLPSSTYTVTAFIVGQQDSNWQVEGAITISNPAPMPATVVSVVDVLPNGAPATISCADGVTIPANSTATCTYSAQTGGVISGDNIVTATLQTSAGNNQYTGSAPVVFGGPTTELSKTVTVSDDLLGGSLGEFGDGQAKSYTFQFQSCSEVTFEEGENSRTFIINNTASIDNTTIDDGAQVTVTCWMPPIIKTANTRYNRVYDYDIVKTVEPAEQTIYFTDTATFAYTLQVTKFIQEENGFAVGGAIVISNPAPIDATLVNIEDILPDAANMTIVCTPDNETPYTVPASGALNCTYSADLPDKTFRINEARATMSNGVILSATAPVDFSAAVVTPINDSAPISDTFWSEVQTVFTDTIFTYTEEFTCAGLAYNQESGFFSGAFTNVAQVLVEGGASDSATATLNCYQLDLSVEKTATPTERPEPGGVFTFDVAVVNNSPVPVTLTSLTDDIYGDLTQATGRMTGTSCALPQTLSANGGQYGCSFTANFTGQPGAAETDTVTAIGADSTGTPVEASDSVTITITDTPSSITLTKTANQTVLPWPGGEVIFTVEVQNTSAVDVVRIDTLTDSIYGNITQVGGKVLTTTCAAPQMLTPGASYQCTFTVNLTLAAEATQNLVETNIVTAIGIDDDGQPLQASDDETVTIMAAQRAVIGNRVFIDIDPDGASSAARLAGNQQQDFDTDGNAIEDNVPGMTVLLFTVDHLFVAAVQTDADGFYQFTDVPPGEYYVVFVNPGVFPGAWVGYNAAIADDVNSDVDPSLPLEPSVEALIDNLLGAGASLDAVRTPTFSIAPGQVYLDLDAGLVDLSGANSVDINGIIWLDANRDGIRQQEETIRISGVTVELYKVNDVQRSDVTRIDQIPTDATGFFEFLGLDAGVYFVKMLIPVNYTITAQNVGDDPTIDSDINRATGESERVTVANETVTIDAGVFQTPTALDPIEEPMIMGHQLFLPTVQR